MWESNFVKILTGTEIHTEMQQLITFMFRDNRMEELRRSATDDELQARLLEEYGLNREAPTD